MEITDSFLTLLQNFAPVFTAPTYQTFVVIVTGWIISQRHRYVTEVIFSVAVSETDTGHSTIASSATPPGTSTPSPCTWPSWSSRFSPRRHLLLGRRRHPLSQTRADPLRRRHDYDPLISSRAKSLVSWGHDWVVLTLIVAFPLGHGPKSSPCPSPCACTATAKG